MQDQSPDTALPTVALPEADLAALARRHRDAGGALMTLIQLAGGRAENLLERLPDATKQQLEAATERALTIAAEAALRARGGRLPETGARMNTAIAAGMGAVGGAGGLPGALAELPLTVTFILRAIQHIAEAEGFDPAAPSTRAACIEVFAAAGPGRADDGAELGFLAARVTLTGPAMSGLIRTVAPRLAAVMGQKLAAQTVPVLGAAAGAAINYSFTGYYQEMAAIRFRLAALARDQALPEEALGAPRPARIGVRPGSRAARSSRSPHPPGRRRRPASRRTPRQSSRRAGDG